MRREYGIMVLVAGCIPLAIISSSLSLQLALTILVNCVARLLRLRRNPYIQILGYSYAPLILLVPLVDFVSVYYLEGLLGGIIHGLLTLLRLLNLLALFTLLNLGIHPMRIAQLLESIGCPRTLTLGVTVALISMPLIERELRQVIEAQSSRGIAVDTVLGKAVRIRAIIQPVIIRSLEHGLEIAQTLLLRGYTLRAPKRDPRLLSMLTAAMAMGVAVAFLSASLP